MWSVEQSPLGRIVVAPEVPAGHAVFYTTSDLEGRLTDSVANDITRFIVSRFGVAASLATCTQVHGVTARRAPADRPWRECDSCDALWTDRTGVALGIKVADCLPIAMVDSVHSVAANIHSGWRGTARQITASTIDTLERETAFRCDSASAWLGPSIRACCFEVGEEVVEELGAAFGDVEPFVDRSRAKPHVDLVGLTASILRTRGFAGERIFDSGSCTRCDGSIFHSYRRGGKGSGRNLAFVAQ